MTDIVLALLLYVAAGTAASIGKSDKLNDSDITKREASEFFPNWVPFKNKHGDELGEFKDVAPKAKVKKRLAPPANFLLKAVAEPEGDDYYEKGQGESDSEDYYEKKDWSDLSRPEVTVAPIEPAKLNNLTDIDGVIRIITQEGPSLAKEIENSIPKNLDEKENPDIKPETLTVKPPTTKIPIKKEVKEHKYEDDIDYEDPQPAEKRKPETEEEKAANEAKKKLILDSVDELKERHAQEQRAISEKVKEEEFDQEAFERDRIHVKNHEDKYAAAHSRKRGKVAPPDYDEYDEVGSWKDKYITRPEKTTAEPTRKTQIVSGKLSVFRNPDMYIVDDETEIPEATTKEYKSTKPPRRFSSKYNANTLTTTERNLAADSPNEIEIVPKDLNKGEAVLFFPKLKNKRKLRTTTKAPDSSVAETVEDKTAKKLTTKPYDLTGPTAIDTTEDYGTTASGNEDLNTLETTAPGNDITTAGDSGEFKTTVGASEEVKTTAGDSEEVKTTAGDSEEVKTTAGDSEEIKTTAGDSEEFKTTAPEKEGDKFTVVNDPTGTGTAADAESTNNVAVTDAVPASSDHKKEEPKDYHVEKGGGHEHHSAHESEHEEHGKKAYEFPKTTTTVKTMTKQTKLKGSAKKEILNQKPWYYHYDINGLHKDSKSKKGHHDKEYHQGNYEDQAGFNKEHHDEKKHYGEHHQEEHGKKHAKYEESGKHSKGHSTKGSHDIHKKEEYEKKVEFFEEDGDTEEEEKHGGYNEEKEHSSGGKYKKGKQEALHVEHEKGDSGHFAKGGHALVEKGHKLAGGHDSHGKKTGARKTAEGHQGGKKWVYHHGHPAKTANLVAIDRRGDKYILGPRFYG